jgi:hypothetical protein
MLKEMFKDQVCEKCGEVKLNHHFCTGVKELSHKTEYQLRIEKRCKDYALNQWLSDYPADMTYEDIIDRLQTDEWSEPMGDDDDEDANRLIEWYIIEGHSGDQIAEFIEDTYDSAVRLVEDLIK